MSRYGRATGRLLLNREDGRLVCHYCRKSISTDNAVGDHYIPLSRGGSDKMNNIVVACRKCDHLKGPLTGDEFLAVKDDPAARKALEKRVMDEMRSNPLRPRLRASDFRRSR